MVSLGQIRKGKKPNHPRVSDRKFLGPEVGEDSKQGMFSGCGRINRITGDPGENLGVVDIGRFLFLGESGALEQGLRFGVRPMKSRKSSWAGLEFPCSDAFAEGKPGFGVHDSFFESV